MSKSLEIRDKKFKEFKSFGESCYDIFKAFSKNDPKARKFEDHYNLCVCPGGRSGGIQKDLIEIFWGSHAIGSEKKINPDFTVSVKTRFEEGATLAFCLNDRGDVAVFLYPAKTDRFRPIEDAICLVPQITPSRLSNKRVLRKLWRQFMAYMECTSLAGSPSLWQRWSVWWMRYAKYEIIEGVWMRPTRLRRNINEFVKFILTVGFSGFLIAFLLKSCD